MTKNEIKQELDQIKFDSNNYRLESERRLEQLNATQNKLHSMENKVNLNADIIKDLDSRLIIAIRVKDYMQELLGIRASFEENEYEN